MHLITFILHYWSNVGLTKPKNKINFVAVKYTVLSFLVKTRLSLLIAALAV
jgi:hypothetical protein